MTSISDVLSLAALLISSLPVPFSEAALLASPARAEEKPVHAEVVERLAAELEQSYVFEDQARALARTLREKAASGAWNALEGPDFARALTEECQAATKDKHLTIRYRIEQQLTNLPPEEERDERRFWQQRNFGYERAERLQGNVGYLELRGFAPIDLARPTAAAAWAFVQDTDALIIDLRRNGGGAPGGVQLFCSYLFGVEPVHLNDIYTRESDETRSFWTLRDLAGRRYLDKPVFVLTGAYTFSGAEECAYNLQTHKRATLIGQTTGGGAHPVDSRRLGPGFTVMLPVSRAINPITKTNWEGVGVKPDVEAAESEALDRAHALAVEALIATEKDDNHKQGLQRLLTELRAKYAR